MHSRLATLEDQLDSLLTEVDGQNDLWQLAADLARKNFKPEALDAGLFGFTARNAGTALGRRC